MKKILFLIFVFSNAITFSQVGINTTAPNAMLEIAPSSSTTPSNTDGLLVPRISAFPATNPTLAQQGMLVYLTTTVGAFTPGFYYWDNPTTTWTAIAGASTAGWQLTGNTVNATTDFLGSTNDADVIFKRNNLRAGRIGLSNTSYGLEALNPNTTGYSNTANGAFSLYSNTTGYYNTANGFRSLYSNTTGYFNTANGLNSLFSNTTGTTNTAYGFQSLYSNTTGYNNTANGVGSLFSNTTGTNNTANGQISLYFNTIGINNTANGIYSLLNNTTGNNNTANGMNSLYGNISGNNNTALGYLADVSSDNLTNATVIGSNAYVTSSNSLVLGSINGTNSATASVNVGIGTTAPTERLHVVGNIKMIDGNEALGKVLTSDANGVASWQTATGGASGWQLTGNTLTATDFLGSTNDADVIFKRNNLRAGRIGLTNTSYGLEALNLNTTGSFNTANGAQSLYSNTTGGYNTANGVNSLYRNTTGYYNTANGMNSLYRNTTGTNNTANGMNSLYFNTTGTNNTANGRNSLYFNTTGNNNTALGYLADVSSDNLTNATVIGSNAYVTSSNSLVLGSINGTNSATASVNVGIGTTAPTERLHVVGKIKMVDGNEALGKVLTSDANGVASWQTATGGVSGWQLTGNTVNATTDFLGSTNNADVIFKRNNIQAGRIGLTNTSYGIQALNPNTTGYYNTAYGMNSLYSNTTGNFNTANGTQSLISNTTGGYNTANGNQSLFSNTTGDFNTANGMNSLLYNTTGNQNTANGNSALFNNTTGNQNTAIGYDAGLNLTTGSNNVFIGANTQPFNNTVSNYININNQIYGNNGLIGIGEANPTRAKLVVNGSVNTYNGSYGYLNGAGNAGLSNVTTANPTSIWASGRIISSEFNATSDNRIKQNVVPVQNALAILSQVSIVNYTKLSKDGATNEIGVIAQEVEKIIPQAVQQTEGDIYNATTKKWEVVQDFRTVNYQTINMITAKAVQELKAQVDLKTDEIKVLKVKNIELESRLLKLEKLIN